MFNFIWSSNRRIFVQNQTNILILIIGLFILISNTIGIQQPKTDGDPYYILGISKNANIQEIRRAYKQLAKEWHPDKNKDSNAQSKFVQINKAYELLSDPERRRAYDQHGIQHEQFNGKHDFSSFNQFDPFDEVFTFATGSSFHFPFSDGISFLHKQSISSKTFEQNVLPKSNTVPQLIIVYQDWCMSCARAAPAWKTVSEELHSIGMDVLSIHGEKERLISRRLGISAVPAIVLLVEGHPYHYLDPAISPAKVVGFVRSHMPLDVIELIDSTNVQNFLMSWLDNRVRVLIFGNGTNIRLRYLLLAFRYRERAAFGYVHPANQNLRSQYGVQKLVDTILVFKESPKPAASLAMADIPHNLMKDLLENNKFLILPRLSSQVVMESICPIEASIYRRRLCVILANKNENQDYLEALRKFAENWSQPRARFAYIRPDKQQDFFNALRAGGVKSDSENLVILWRQDSKRAAYEWMEWDVTNVSAQKLESLLLKFLNERKRLAHFIELKELTDEHAKTILSKMLKKVSLTVEFFRRHLTREIVIQATSLIATVLFVIAGGFIMAYLVRLEEESIAAKARASSRRGTSEQHSNTPSHQTTSRRTNTNREGVRSTSYYTNSTELKLHEMRGETYNGLVKLIKPGCRTVVLLLDTETKGSLLPKFQRCVWPYRKNKSLQFGFMHVDKGGGLTWYKELLLLSLTEPRSLNINPRNCVGTVLSLNGYRRYFCVFHATLPGGAIKRQKTVSTGGYRNAGFLGFDSDQSSEEEHDDVESRREVNASSSDHPPSILFTSHLLDNLSNWLDRLFEGSTHRYHINYWPDFPVK